VGAFGDGVGLAGEGGVGEQLHSALAKWTDLQPTAVFALPQVKSPLQFLTNMVFASAQPKVVPKMQALCELW
jgi:hypothetical protein